MLKSIVLVALMSFSTNSSHLAPNYAINPFPVSEYTFDEDCIAYGISIDEGWDLVLYTMLYPETTFMKYSVAMYDGSGDDSRLQYQTDIQTAILRYEDSDTYACIVRVVLNPVWKERDFGFFGLGSKWDDWYFRRLTISCNLSDVFTITDWSPKTKPNEYVLNNTVSVSSGGDFSISASFTDIQTLEIVSDTNVATNHFGIDFLYEPNDSYNHNSGIFITMFKFQLNQGCTFDYISFSKEIVVETTYYGVYYFHECYEKLFISPFTYN